VERKPYTVLGLDDVEAVPWPGGITWHPVRMDLGLRAFGINGYSADREGVVVVEPHDEASEGRGHEELYIVLAGRARFTLDGEEIDVTAGQMVHLGELAVHRQAIALEPGTQVLALGGPPTFEPAGSEWLMRARPLIECGDLAGARRLLEDGAAQLPRSAAVPYGFALLLAAEGRRDEAAAALRDAVAREPRLEAEARGEPSLAELL
jgi:cupin domain